MAADKLFPYTPVPKNLSRLLETIPSVGTPPRATQEWLASIGFSGGNNKRNLAVIRQVGIIGSQGQPTDLWVALRSRDRAAFGAGVRKAYADLFATYPDADRKDDEALIAFVRSKTDYAEKVQRLAVRTFKVFVEFGDFDGDIAPAELVGADLSEEGAPGGGGQPRRRAEVAGPDAGSVALTVNIQLQLPPSNDGDVYDKLFASMSKNLRGLVNLE